MSKGAVSFALNDRPGVAPETRQRILEVADRLGWTPSPRARALAVSRALAVGLVVARTPEIFRADAFFPAFISGLETVLSQHGHALLLMVAEHDDGGQIGRRYRCQDEIGTPWALTVDEQTLVDETVTIRDRDTLAQERISISRAREHLLDRLAAPWAPPARG